MNSARGRQTTWGLLLLIALSASLIASTCGKPSGRLLKKGTGIAINSSADLQPDADPGPAKIVYAGTVIPVQTKRRNEDGDYVMDFWYQGTIMETEKYRSTPTEFDLVNAAGEDYSPPLPLLYFPMNAGDSWKWSGQMVISPTSHNATAVVSTREDEINVGTMAHALVVEVDLSIDNGTTSPATRKLTFWFVKGKGVVKREFGASTSRIPATASQDEVAN